MCGACGHDTRVDLDSSFVCAQLRLVVVFRAFRRGGKPNDPGKLLTYRRPCVVRLCYNPAQCSYQDSMRCCHCSGSEIKPHDQMSTATFPPAKVRRNGDTHCMSVDLPLPPPPVRHNWCPSSPGINHHSSGQSKSWRHTNMRIPICCRWEKSHSIQQTNLPPKPYANHTRCSQRPAAHKCLPTDRMHAGTVQRTIILTKLTWTGADRRTTRGTVHTKLPNTMMMPNLHPLELEVEHLGEHSPGPLARPAECA